MGRVLYSDLDYPGDDGLYYYNGEPFTGVSYTLDWSGGLASEAEMRCGLECGMSKRWFPSGSLALERHTGGGVCHGMSREWHENGRPASEEEYELGVCLWRRRWDEEGNLVEDYRLRESDADYATLQILREHYLPGPTSGGE